jgi:hypothetical protein
MERRIEELKAFCVLVEEQTQKQAASATEAKATATNETLRRHPIPHHHAKRS